MPYISLEDQGFYAPSRVIRGAVDSFLSERRKQKQDEFDAAEEQRQQKEFELNQQTKASAEARAAAEAGRAGTEFGWKGEDRTAGRDAYLAEIQQRLLNSQLGIGQAQEIAKLPVLQQLAVQRGRLPEDVSQETSFDPYGRPVVNEQTSLGGMPFGGQRSTGAPPVSISTNIAPTAVPGVAVSTQERTAMGADGKPVSLGKVSEPQRTYVPSTSGGTGQERIAVRVQQAEQDLAEAQAAGDADGVIKAQQDLMFWKQRLSAVEAPKAGVAALQGLLGDEPPAAPTKPKYKIKEVRN